MFCPSVSRYVCNNIRDNPYRINRYITPDVAVLRIAAVSGCDLLWNDVTHFHWDGDEVFFFFFFCI